MKKAGAGWRSPSSNRESAGVLASVSATTALFTPPIDETAQPSQSISRTCPATHRATLTRAESAGSTGVEGSSKKKGSTSAKSGAPDSPSSMSSFQATLAAKIAGKKWVGKRRTADVVAATKVECLVLGRKEMEWAITHDETIKNELAKDIDSRRVQTQAKLEKSKSAKEGRATKGTAPEDVDVAA